MTEGSGNTGSTALPVSPLVQTLTDKVGGDPSGHVKLLSGYLGPASDPDHWRLYQSPDLHEHLEGAHADVLHSAQSSDGADAGRTYLWVKRDAQLQHTKPAIPSDQASGLLVGDIVQGHAAAATHDAPPAVESMMASGDWSDMTRCGFCPTGWCRTGVNC